MVRDSVQLVATPLTIGNQGSLCGHMSAVRSVIGIQGLESESVKKKSDSFRFRFLPTYIGGRIIAFRFKSVSDATSVRPIVRTSRTAFVCASDYDDRTQFHMFEQKNEHG